MPLIFLRTCSTIVLLNIFPATISAMISAITTMDAPTVNDHLAAVEATPPQSGQSIVVSHGNHKTKWALEGDGAGRVVCVTLAPRSRISMQRGAMLCMTPNVQLSVNYGFRKSYRRLLGGESLFHTTARVNGEQDGKVHLSVDDDVHLFHIQGDDTNIMIMPSHYVASSPGVQLQLASLKKMGLWKRVLSNTRLFFMIATGKGAIALESTGQLRRQHIATTSEEPFLVDNANVVAWTSDLDVKPYLASQNNKGGKKKSVFRRAMSSLMNGEGIVMAFSGTGTVFYQTRLDRISKLKKRMTRFKRRRTLLALAKQ